MEIGAGQAEAVSGDCRGTAASILETIRPDLQGIPRIVVARRASTG